MSKTQASAYSLAAAIYEGRDNEGCTAAREVSGISVSSGQSAFAQDEAAHARRTLIKNAAADFTDPVTRKAYRVLHGRRMSTLRSMQRQGVQPTDP
jgi:hypothetical protein